MISSKVNKYKPKQIQKRFSSIHSFFQKFSSGEESIFLNQARLSISDKVDVFLSKYDVYGYDAVAAKGLENANISANFPLFFPTMKQQLSRASKINPHKG